MNLPKKLIKFGISFITDEKNNNIVISSAFISGEKEKEILNEIIKRYNEHEDLKFTAKLSAWFGAIATVAFCILFIYLQSNPPR